MVAGLAALLVAILLARMAMRERRARRRFQILADIAAVSDAAAPLEETFDAICAILVPQIADFCMIDVLDESRVPRRAAVRVAVGAKPEFERGLAERMPSTPPRMVADEDSALAPRFYERVSEDDVRGLSHDEEDFEFLRSLGMRSAVTVALQARGEITGALTIAVAWSGRRYKREDAHFAWILSGRVALALDNAGLFADLERAERARSRIAETLQRGLLPPPLPHIPGWSVAAMYRPAGAENEVGGDFYDLFRVPGGWMLAIGDVTGRGAHAASITAVARYTVRTAAVLTDDPLVALRTLNRALLARGDAALCSLAAMTLSEDPGSRSGSPSPATRRRCWSTASRSARWPAPTPCSAPSPTPSGPSRTPTSDRVSRSSSSPTGSPRPRGRRDASARTGCAPTSAAPATRRSPCSGSRAPCTPSPRAGSRTTWRCWRSPARRATAPGRAPRSWSSSAHPPWQGPVWADGALPAGAGQAPV